MTLGQVKESKRQNPTCEERNVLRCCHSNAWVDETSSKAGSTINLGTSKVNSTVYLFAVLFLFTTNYRKFTHYETIMSLLRRHFLSHFPYSKSI